MLRLIPDENGSLNALELCENLRTFFADYEDYITVWDSHCEYMYVVEAKIPYERLKVIWWDYYDDNYHELTDPLFDLKSDLIEYIGSIGLPLNTITMTQRNVNEETIKEQLQPLFNLGQPFTFKAELNPDNPQFYTFIVTTLG